MAKISAETGMKLLWILGLTLCQTVSEVASASKSVNMSQVCALVPDGSKLANADSCNTFYTCSSGKALLQSCDATYYFDKDIQQCGPQWQVNCLNDGDDPCAERDVGAFAPVPGSCSGYYYCSEEGPLRGDCPSGENFNPSEESCEYEVNYPCGPASSACGSGSSKINLCTFIQNGIFFGSPSKCELWNLCENNQLSSGTCDNNLVFNVELRTCDYRSNWQCSQISKGGISQGVGDSCESGTCTKKGDRKAANTCSSFYECDGSEYQLLSCPSSLFFDTISKTCVNRLQARNDCDRCEGSSATFVNQYSTKSCTGYLSCENGVQVSNGNCAEGYFDEVLGGCIKGDQPKYACCNPGVKGSITSTTVATTSESTETEKPDEKSEEEADKKSEEKPNEKPDEKSEEEADKKSEEKPNEKPDEESKQDSQDKSGEKISP